MFQKFNKNTIESKFIKSLISSIYVPTVEIWNVGLPIIEGLYYITPEYILKCEETWPINSLDTSLGPQSPHDETYFTIIENYIEGNFYRGLTSNFISNNSLYDSMTHYRLGLFLRMIRDLHKIDLMPYYNCWDNTISDKIRIQNITYNNSSDNYSGSIIDSNNIDDGLETLLVPISFNHDYTIYINSNYPIQLATSFIDKDSLIIKDYAKNIMQYQASTFSNAILYNVKSTNAQYDPIYREYLTLIIQVPKTISKNIVVIEDNLKDNKLITINKKNEVINTIINSKDPLENKYLINNWSDSDLNDYCKIYPGLIRGTGDYNHAFDSRLIEYLLLNVISMNDEITDNVKRIQSYSSSYENQKYNKQIYNKSYIKGIWDKSLRKYLYDITTKNEKLPITINISGYVDKDVENIITRGQI